MTGGVDSPIASVTGLGFAVQVFLQNCSVLFLKHRKLWP
ncbi:hypothetical protein MIZ03_2574 [Rhodoferax lithotrophicus]|uniref:Uncharacterized protein n=1 Tax=Rhodoferax lithotrophicus TaxID=2798804 RepID=A0ABM7MN49_9BURK|nr:hypothetical protein MIZ03_2574 [Rhodoferax sp. MIZ03]